MALAWASAIRRRWAGALIRAGDRARHRDWSAAARFYALALRLQPGRADIWIQLGHARAESGSCRDAAVAYGSAARLLPGEMEPLVLLAETAKRRRAYPLAAKLHLAAFARATPGRGDRSLFDNVSVGGEWISDAHAAELGGGYAPGTLIEALLSGVGVDDAAASSRLLLDVSDLIHHLARHTTLSGIQRVQACVVAELDGIIGPTDWDAVVFAPRRREWVRIEQGELARLVELARGGKAVDAAERVRGEVFAALTTRAPCRPRPGSVLVNLGASWLLHGYSEAIVGLKAATGMRYKPFVHDLIPLLRPDWVDRETAERFARWVNSLPAIADGCFVNSASTRTDLLRLVPGFGSAACPDVEVVTLDARWHAEPTPGFDATGDKSVERENAALMVATFEERKNHRLLFDTWSRLALEHGSAMPRLICVGRSTAELATILPLLARPELAGLVELRHDVSDQALHALYESCLFTIYPSAYEGWGMPVTESLCHGRVPVVARNSSLPEAGGELALYFESGPTDALAAAVRLVAFDPDWRREREALIGRDYRPRRWSDVARQVVAAALKPAP